MSSIVVSGDTSGSVTLQAPAVAGTTVITLPSSSMTLGNGSLLNIQYFTTAGTATYTPTTGTNSVIVEVVGGGGGSSLSTTLSGGTGGTSSFGALVSATGGGAYNAAGAGASGDLNLTGGQGGRFGTTATSIPSANYIGGIAGLCYGTYGFGANIAAAPTTTAQVAAGSGGGAARKKITSSFSGVTVTVGAAGTAGTTGNAGNSGIVIVYEYA